MSGFLVVFEGQDGSGKSTLLTLTAEQLCKEGYPVFLVPEFSANVLGEYLKKTLEENKFLRLNTIGPSAFTETMYVLSDLYSQDELEIKPAVKSGKIVLKERHIDSILACQIPKILDDYLGESVGLLLPWLIEVTKHLTKPGLRVFLEVNKETLWERINQRGESVSEEDLIVFGKRQEIYNQLSETDGNWLWLPNNNDVEPAAALVINEIKKQYDIFSDR
jgi:dTMP kinase